METFQWLGFFEKLMGFDDEVYLEFAMKFQNPKCQEFTTIVKGLVIHVNEDSIGRFTTLPRGIHWNKQERQEAINAKRGLILPN